MPLLQALTTIVGKSHILTDTEQSEYFRTGFRSGQGAALAVVFPATLWQQWQVLEACVAANTIIIMQAANTGLTEGSTPSGDDYDREIIIINTTRISDIILLNNGEQIIGFSGATLHALEKKLKPLKRSPHSVIGSSCIGASIVGGVANNSGGALVKRGPAYTELALYAQLDINGELKLINHLGLELGDTPREIFQNLQQQADPRQSLQQPLQQPLHKGEAKAASDPGYQQRLRDIDADTPSRYNANPECLFEASGCAGKLAVFAVRLDTFPVAEQEQTFYIGCNNPADLQQLRRDILSQFTYLPDSAEYLHRDCFNIAERYGKDTFLLIDYLGTAFMPKLFAVKGRLDAWLNKRRWLPSFLSDRVMQGLSRLWPNHLPRRLLDYRERYEHHLILKVSDQAITETRLYLENHFQNGGYLECTEQEAKKAYLLRFSAAGAAIRYQLMHNNTAGEVLALDIALKRNEQNWVEDLPASIREHIDTALYYGHFLCHVFHQDYILKQGADAASVKQAMLTLLAQRGAKYPAEHNVGHLYEAEPPLANFYATLDPTNTFNPGIGKTPKHQTVQ